MRSRLLTYWRINKPAPVSVMTRKIGVSVGMILCNHPLNQARMNHCLYGTTGRALVFTLFEVFVSLPLSSLRRASMERVLPRFPSGIL